MNKIIILLIFQDKIFFLQFLTKNFNFKRRIPSEIPKSILFYFLVELIKSLFHHFKQIEKKEAQRQYNTNI